MLAVVCTNLTLGHCVHVEGFGQTGHISYYCVWTVNTGYLFTSTITIILCVGPVLITCVGFHHSVQLLCMQGLKFHCLEVS